MTMDASRGRFCHSGEHLPGFHLVDLHMYDTSLFANACVLSTGDTAVVFDAGTSLTTREIVTHLDYHGIAPRIAHIVPSHHHFDHAGGIAPLLRHFKKRHVAASVVTTDEMAPLLQDPAPHARGARPLFGDLVGDVAPVAPADMTILREGEKLALDGGHELLLLGTPGHCRDHVSPVILDGGRPVACFLGEALGINLRKVLSPLPAATAPGYERAAYRQSIERVMHLGVDAAFFSHVGGVRGRDEVRETCQKALDMLGEITRFTVAAAGQGPVDARAVVTSFKHRYQEYLATCVMDGVVVDNLSFLVALGILRDAGLK